MVAMSNMVKNLSSLERTSHSGVRVVAATDLSAPYYGAGERPDRTYCHGDGADCEKHVAKIDDKSTRGLCNEVVPIIYATGGMDDASLYRCDPCFFAQRAALLDDVGADSVEKKRKDGLQASRPQHTASPTALFEWVTRCVGCGRLVVHLFFSFSTLSTAMSSKSAARWAKKHEFQR